MERPPESDPNAFTQPIPVVPVAPPPRPEFARVAPAATVVPSAQPLPPAYLHRFGSIPFYLFARFMAFVLDIFGVGFVVATFAYHATDVGYFVVIGHDANGFTTLASFSLGVALLFAFLCESLFGTTLGKAVFALHVRRGNGRHAGAGRVFVRYLLRPIDMLVIGPLLALVTPRHQRLGDLLVGTVVARSRIGAFASLIGLILIAVVGYAQVTFGGGLTSAIGVSAETANYAPAFVARVTSALGVPNVRQPSVAPQTQSTDTAATPAPLPSDNVQ